MNMKKVRLNTIFLNIYLILAVMFKGINEFSIFCIGHGKFNIAVLLCLTLDLESLVNHN